MEIMSNSYTKKKLPIIILLLALTLNFLTFSNGITTNNHRIMDTSSISVNGSGYESDSSFTELNLMAVSGRKSWKNFSKEVGWELVGYIPGGRYQTVVNKIYFVVTKGIQLGTKDWVGLAWTVADAISPLIPGAHAAKIFLSIAKLTPSF